MRLFGYVIFFLYLCALNCEIYLKNTIIPQEYGGKFGYKEIWCNRKSQVG